jgi:hypothetical protein
MKLVGNSTYNTKDFCHHFSKPVHLSAQGFCMNQEGGCHVPGLNVSPFPLGSLNLVDSTPPEEGFHVSGWKSGLASLCTSLLVTCSTPTSSLTWVGTSSPLTCCRKSVMLRGLTSSAIHTSSSKYQQGIQRLTCPFCSYIKLSLVTATFLIAIPKHNQKSLLYCILTIGHSLLQHFCSKPIFFLLLFKHCIQNNKAGSRNRTDGFR